MPLVPKLSTLTALPNSVLTFYSNTLAFTTPSSLTEVHNLLQPSPENSHASSNTMFTYSPPITPKLMDKLSKPIRKLKHTFRFSVPTTPQTGPTSSPLLSFSTTPFLTVPLSLSCLNMNLVPILHLENLPPHLGKLSHFPRSCLKGSPRCP